MAQLQLELDSLTQPKRNLCKQLDHKEMQMQSDYYQDFSNSSISVPSSLQGWRGTAAVGAGQLGAAEGQPQQAGTL